MNKIERNVMTIATSIALLALAGPGLADSLPDARGLVDRHIEAIGGRAAVESQTQGTLTGRFQMPAAGIDGELVMAIGAVDRIGIHIEMPGIGEIRSGIHNEVVWSMDPFSGPRILEGDERALQLEQTNPEAALREDSLVEELETVELAEFGGESCYRVRVAWRSGRESHDCYAVDSGLLVATESIQVSPMGEISITMLLKDYQDLGGFKAATRTEQTVMGQQQIMTLESFNAGEPDPDLLALPAPIQALAGAVNAP